MKVEGRSGAGGVIAPESDNPRPGKGVMAWWTQLLVRVGVFLAAVAALSWSVSYHSYRATVVLALVVGALGILIHRKLAALELTPIDPGPKAGALLAATEVGAVVCLVAHLRIFTMPGFIGLSLVVFAAGQLATEIRTSRWLHVPIALLLAANFLTALVVGLVGIGGWTVLVLAVVLLLPTLSITTEVLLERPRPRARNVWIVGGVLFAVGSALLWPVGGFVFMLVAAIVLFALVGMITSNTNSDALFILVALGLIWSQYPRSVPNALPAGGGAEIVALGDSYISGEGAGKYYADTNVKSAKNRDECRRSPTSYPVLAASSLKMQLDDLACSGAVIRNLGDVGQYLGENPPGQRQPDPVTGAPHPKLSQLALFDLRHRDLAQVQNVFVSIGGNDVGFGNLVEACLAPGDCSERGQHWLDGLKDLGARLDPVYEQLRAKFGDRVVVVPYPIPIREQGCSIFGSTFTDHEHLFINGFATQLDLVIKGAAARNHLRYLTEMERVFTDSHTRICDTRPGHAGVNYLALNPVDGAIDPAGWLHNSMHPNAKGHRLMAAVVVKWLSQPRPAPQPAGDVPAARVSLPEVIQAAAPKTPIAAKDSCNPAAPIADCKLSDGAWRYKQTRLALRSHLPGLAALVGGAWALWFGILWELRSRRERPVGTPTGGAS